MKYQIRKMQEHEYQLLEDFLYEAIYIPEGVEPPSRDILDLPELKTYFDDFGKKDDHALVAEVDGKIIGAVWTRIMNDYGHVDEETPSISMSMYKDYRGLGIGTEMLKQMLVALKEKGYKRVSLSVQQANYAVKMYLHAGFEIFEVNEEDYIMVCKL